MTDQPLDDERQYLTTHRQAQQAERDARGFAERVARAAARGQSVALAQAALTGALAQAESLRARLAEYDARTAADRKGTWMPTWSGRRFWLLDPRPGDIDVHDIAQALSRISRFNGMTAGPWGYTVAQHSVHASHLSRREHQLAVLLHDAPEAYAGDVITPLKELLGETYEAIESAIMRAVAARFGFVWEDAAVQEAVREADKIMLVTEVRDFLPLRVIRVDPPQRPLPYELDAWPQDKARARFLDRFDELTGASAAGEVGRGAATQ